jgi:hypothetical protein
MVSVASSYIIFPPDFMVIGQFTQKIEREYIRVRMMIFKAAFSVMNVK